MDTREIPAVPEELITALDRYFPEQSPNKGESIEKLMWRGGERNVVRTLRAWFEMQNGTVLEPQVILNVQS